MTYQHSITHYSPATDDARNTSYAIILLFVTFICSSVIAYYATEMTNLVIAAISILLAGLTLWLIIKQHRVPFVTIDDETMNYFDSQQDRILTIRRNEITHIHTKFCELIIHTPGEIHSLNLSLVRNAQTRWEIKEMIRNSTQSHSATFSHTAKATSQYDHSTIGNSEFPAAFLSV